MSPKQHISPGARVARRLAAGAAAALCALAALAPGAANAGTYHMYNCRVPGKETGTKGPWTFTANAFGISNLVAYDDCAVNGGSFGNYLPAGRWAATRSRSSFSARTTTGCRSLR